MRNALQLRQSRGVHPTTPQLVVDASMSALCRALAPAEVRLSYSAGHALPFRIEVSSAHGVVSFRGESAEAAARAALADSDARDRKLAELAIEPSGEGPYVDALREWIDQVTPPRRVPPQLRLVR